jgi:hypothetical protein
MTSQSHGRGRGLELQHGRQADRFDPAIR